MTAATYLLAGLAVLAGSFFTTVTGFGFALVALPLLNLVLSVKASIILVLFLALVTRLVNMAQTWGQWQWQVVAAFALGSLVGAVPGVLALQRLPLRQMELFLGCVLLLAALLLGRQFSFPVADKRLGRLAAGCVSGFFGTATGVSGPPIILYCLNEGMEKGALRSNLIWYFGFQSFCSLAFNYLVGNTQAVEDWTLLGAMLPAMLIGTLVGNRFFSKLNPALFRRLALLVVGLGGLSLVWRALA